MTRAIGQQAIAQSGDPASSGKEGQQRSQGGTLFSSFLPQILRQDRTLKIAIRLQEL